MKRLTDYLSAVLTIALLTGSAVDERKKLMFNGVLFAVFTTLAFFSVAFAGIDSVGENIWSKAGTILKPIGWTVAVFYTWQAFSSDHDKMKNFAKAGGGALVGLWDTTRDFIKGLFGS